MYNKYRSRWLIVVVVGEEKPAKKMSVIRGDGVIVYLCMVMRGMIMFWCNNCMKISPI